MSQAGAAAVVPAASSTRSSSITDVPWDELDKPKFYTLAFTSFLGLRVLLHPTLVVKTRMQATGEVYSGTVAAVRHIVKQEGMRGVYKGFGVASLSLLPRQAYFTIYELLRRYLGPESSPSLYMSMGAQQGEVVRNMVAGAGASVAMQVATVPIDVVSQRLMVAGIAGGEGGPTTAAAIAREVYATGGVRGFYRGFAAAVMQFAPTSAAWWSAYGLYKFAPTSAAWWSAYGLYKEPLAARIDALPLNLSEEARQILVQATAGYLAGATTVVLTNPLDVIRTRLQVRRGAAAAGATMLSEARALWAAAGARALMKGLGPRMISVAPASVLVVTTYEYIKRVSRKPAEAVPESVRQELAAAAQLCRRYSGQPV
ncbi:mitochondrial carrier domain-containing protein [Tribonema minus]|uniref:Mitochondrial carrier domain-containing protein n=1 Tax=Tribonema minus TaxID=303371 RepID=A0A835YRA5_9STRA|nr:mitochondrial carrier domain-containing protein [Tribonema minus]